MLLMEYSLIAFSLAQRSHLNKEKYAVAPLLKDIVSQLLSSELFSENVKKELCVLVSETELDFDYAAGNHNVSSIRMAPIIRYS